MSDDPAVFHHRVEALLARRRWKPTDLARETDLPIGTIRQILKGSLPSIFNARKIAEALGTSLDWLAGQGPWEVGFQEPAARYEPPPSDLVFVPRLDVRASAGPGALVEAEAVDGELAFRRELVRELGVSAPGALRVLTASGDSMEPVIRPGDLLLVDTGIDRIVHEGIYVVVYDGVVVVKRIAVHPGGSLYLLSENPRVPAMEIAREDRPGVHIAGRVVRVIRAL